MMRKAASRNIREEYVRLGEELISALNARDFEEFISHFSDESSLVFPGSNALGGFYLGKKKILRFLQKMFVLVPDIRFKTLNAISSERLAVIEWLSSGITKKGIPYENRGVSIFEIESGKVKELRQYLDTEKI
jgi:uncharacterized protein